MLVGDIVFRKIDNCCQNDRWESGVKWYVEFHDAEFDCPFPKGIAFVSGPDYRKILYFVFVADMYRRKGVATELVRACRARWPNIEITEAISDAGEAFLGSIGRASMDATHV